MSKSINSAYCSSRRLEKLRAMKNPSNQEIIREVKEMRLRPRKVRPYRRAKMAQRDAYLRFYGD